MGKRPRTPHFITGIGDGNVHDGNTKNEDVSRLRGNNDGNRRIDDDSGRNNAYNRHHEQIRNHHHNFRSQNAQSDIHNAIPTRNDLLHRMNENDGVGGASDSSADPWRESFHDHNSAIPVMDLNLDLNNINGGMGIGVGDIAKPVDSSGPWQVSAFAFLGVIVVVAIVLHYVSETSSGSGNNNKSNEIPSGSSSKNRHHSGSYSRPYQYRRRQRQRRMQKLRKKKTDEWSDDEEPIQNGAGLLSMSNTVFSSYGTRANRNGDGLFDGGYGQSDQPYPYEYDDYDYENEYDNNNNNNNNANRSVYHQSNYYQEPNSYLSAQDISLRRTGNTRDSYDYYATNNQASPLVTTRKSAAGSAVGVVPTYKSPAASRNLMESTSSPAKPSVNVFRSTTTTPQRGISPMNSYSSAGSGSRQMQSTRQRQNKQNNNHSSTDSVSSPIWEIEKDSNHNSNGKSQGKKALGNPRNHFTPESYAVGSALSWQHRQDDTNRFSDDPSLSLRQQPASLTAANINSTDEFYLANRSTELGARLLDSGSRFSSFASIGDVDIEGSQRSNSNDDAINLEDRKNGESDAVEDRPKNKSYSGHGEIEKFDSSPHSSHFSSNSNHNIGSPSISVYEESYSSAHSHHQQNVHQRTLLLTPGNCDETPIIGNARKTITFGDDAESSFDAQINYNTEASPIIPYVPRLKNTPDTDTGLSPVLFSSDPPPRSILMDELRLVEMETGSSTHWNIENSESSQHEDHASFGGDHDVDELDISASGEIDSRGRASSYDGSDISIPSGDPRKSIIHKRQNLTIATDAATSLQSSIDFDELELQEVIGGGGFGQVWKATWRGTPVAVKVLTGSAQNTHIAKAILEEFKAEINLLKGMRHPNICLYMGACLTPPNRAIITELAANGSAWDSLRLPLVAPYIAADGTANGCWPLSLYLPGRHGVPPSSNGSSLSSEISAPIPPRGTWPWELVKRVSCGAARGMAYLHSGKPPVLHRDLKSANLLLDESYTTKVCDFGLSRLKAQSRSMTANCGTVQWMAPEVLANRSYDEKADVFSFGIIVWELLSRECPYDGMTAIQCALAVLNRDKRPEIPKWCPPGLHALIKSCIRKDPSERPTFAEVIISLNALK